MMALRCRQACVFSLGILVSVVAIETAARAQDDKATQHLAGVMGRLKTDDPQHRMNTFYELLELGLPGGLKGRTTKIPSALDEVFRLAPDRADEVKLTLIGLLDAEKTSASSDVRRTEEYSNYRGDLIMAVASLKDIRAVSLLVDNLTTGNMATRAVAAFGQVSLDRVLSHATDESVIWRNAVARTLCQMIDSPGVTCRLSSDQSFLENSALGPLS